MAQALGVHILLELYDCPEELLRDPIESRRILLAAATAMDWQRAGAWEWENHWMRDEPSAGSDDAASASASDPADSRD